MQKLSEIMTRDVQVVPPTCTVQEAAQHMRQLDVGAIPVCDGQKLIGIVTDRDLAIRASAEGRDPKLTKITDVMSPEVAWCFEDASLEEVARTMHEKQIRRIPVLDRQKKLVGIVALGDLATSSAPDQTKAQSVRGVSQTR